MKGKVLQVYLDTQGRIKIHSQVKAVYPVDQIRDEVMPKQL